jgi:3-isopropylmalate dehydrogenase
MSFRIAVIPGDGIGPEVISEGIRVLEAATAGTGTNLEFRPYDLGAERYLRTGEILPDSVFAELQASDAIYLGAVGDPRVTNPQYAAGLLLRLRFELDLWVNLRPSKLLAPGLTPLRDASTIDLVVVRENTEGAYVGIGGQFKRGTPDEITIQEDLNTRKGVERIQRYAFELAGQRRQVGYRGRLTMVDKSNALYHAHDLWQRVFALQRQRHPDIEAEHLFVDAAAMQLVKDPGRFDVVVTTNMFGDILSDLASELVGGLGQAPSANINPDTRRGLFEPVHGSAPKHAGKGIANPVGAILAGAMMLRHLGASAPADRIETAVMAAAKERSTTKDLGGELTTRAAAEAVLANLTASRTAGSASTPVRKSTDREAG